MEETKESKNPLSESQFVVPTGTRWRIFLGIEVNGLSGKVKVLHKKKTTGSEPRFSSERFPESAAIPAFTKYFVACILLPY